MRTILILTVLAAGSAGCTRVPVHPPEMADSRTTDNGTPPQLLLRSYELASSGLPSDGFWKSTPRLVDLNQDGMIDLLVHARLEEGPRIWLGDGKGHWQESRGLLKEAGNACGGGVSTGDLNRDGRIDIVVADHCLGLSVYLADRNGHWRSDPVRPNSGAGQKLAGAEINPFMGTEDAAIGDVNEDGHPDIVAAAADRGGFAVFLGDGTGKRWKEMKSDGLPSAEDPEPGDEQEAGWAMEVLLQDVNKDGHLDVAASYYRGPRVWLGNGKGHWTSYSANLSEPSIGGIYRQISLADVNKDGRTDLIAANSVNGAEVFLQTADGWSPAMDALPNLRGGAESVGAGDLDRDGNMDLIVGGRLDTSPATGYGLFVLRGDGTGRFALAKSEPALPSTLRVVWGIAVNDIDRDGWLDFASATGGQSTAGDSLPLLQTWLSKANRLAQH